MLTQVFRDVAPRTVVELTDRRYARPTISRTFEGRDRFAPAAAWLAKGIELTALGRGLTSWQTLEMPTPVIGEHAIVGEVISVDRFGNLVTNIDRPAIDRFHRMGALEISADGRHVSRLVTTYAEVDAGSTCALFGSGDYLEIAVSGGSAAATLGMGRGATVTVTRR